MTIDQLLPRELVAQIPPIRARGVPNPDQQTAWARFTVPATGEVFYILETDGADRCYVFYVAADSGTMGGQHVSLTELFQPLGGDLSQVVRDVSFVPRPITDSFLHELRHSLAA